jgi:hypothetical protein
MCAEMEAPGHSEGRQSERPLRQGRRKGWPGAGVEGTPPWYCEYKNGNEYLHSEKYRTEGKAREEILLKLFEQGWIRARRYHRPYRWTLNVFSMTEQTVKTLKYFAEVMISNGK